MLLLYGQYLYMKVMDIHVIVIMNIVFFTFTENKTCTSLAKETKMNGLL